MDNYVDNHAQEPESLIQCTEDKLKHLRSTITRYSGQKVQSATITDYLVNIDHMEQVVSQLISKLHEDVDKLWVNGKKRGKASHSNVPESDMSLPLQKRVWGEKETVLSSLTKLVSLQDKMLALKKELADMLEQQEGEHLKETMCDGDDAAIIKRYFASQYTQGEENETTGE